MQHDPFHMRNQAISHIDSSRQQDVEAIEQLRLGWQQFRATQQQTITIKFLLGLPVVDDESNCVEGTIEVRDVR